MSANPPKFQGGFANIRYLPKFHVSKGFACKKHIFKYIKIRKIVTMLRSFDNTKMFVNTQKFAIVAMLRSFDSKNLYAD